jgi:hypothetical protein
VPPHAWAPGVLGGGSGELEPTDGLNSMDLPAFDAVLQGAGAAGPQLRALEAIKLELRAPFRDVRRPFERASPEALLRLLTREPAAALRPGVRFHEGEAFTSDDVVFSIARAQAPSSNFGTFVDTITRVEPVDALTVDIITRIIDPILPNKIASIFMMSQVLPSSA